MHISVSECLLVAGCTGKSNVVNNNYCLHFKTFQHGVVFFSFVLCSMCIGKNVQITTVEIGMCGKIKIHDIVFFIARELCKINLLFHLIKWYVKRKCSSNFSYNFTTFLYQCLRYVKSGVCLFLF